MNEPNENTTPDDMPSIVPAAVRELLEQRGTYRDWLSRLDDIGGKYRNEVADRVRLDYEARLEEVGEELEGHRHELVSTLEQRRNGLDELADDFERRSAELEEAELRFQVGEFDDGTWEGRRTELTGGMKEIEAELGQARRAVEALENVLDELADAAPSAPAARRPAVRAVAAKPAETAKASESAPTVEADEVAAGKPAADGPSGSSGRAPSAVPRGTARTPPEVAEDARETIVTPIGSAPKRAQDVAAEDAPEATPEEPTSPSPQAGRSSDEDYLDELEFLESLSLDDPDSFDAVSRMLEDEEDR